MNSKTIGRLAADALAIEAETAKDAGTIGYMARALVQATMPHKFTEDLRHERRNGHFKLTMVAGDAEIGLPYGSIPRLLLAWIGAEALRTGSRELELGNSMSAFVRELGLEPTGGSRGSITRLKDQSLRLFSCGISCTFMEAGHARVGELLGVGTAELWWNQGGDGRSTRMPSTLTLSEAFYQELTEHPVPLDVRVLRALRKSPLALDIFAWLAYRVNTLNRSDRPTVVVSWEGLQLQFGAGYPKSSRGLCDFRRAFLRELDKVKAFYPKAQVNPEPFGLRIWRSPEHVPIRAPRRSRDGG